MSLSDTIQKVWTDFMNFRKEVDKSKRELLDLTRRFDLLSNKLNTPGTKFLIDLEYRMVYDAILTVPRRYLSSDTFLILPGLVNSPVIETLPGALHADYLLSAYCPVVDSPVVCGGVSWSPDGPVAGVQPYDALLVSMVRTYKIDPIRVDVTVQVTNPCYETSRTVAVRVWRHLGIGS